MSSWSHEKPHRSSRPTVAKIQEKSWGVPEGRLSRCSRAASRPQSRPSHHASNARIIDSKCNRYPRGTAAGILEHHRLDLPPQCLILPGHLRSIVQRSPAHSELPGSLRVRERAGTCCRLQCRSRCTAFSDTRRLSRVCYWCLNYRGRITRRSGGRSLLP